MAECSYEMASLAREIGELRLVCNALLQRIEANEQRLAKLERRPIFQTPEEHAEAQRERHPQIIGSIAGQPYEVTISGAWLDGMMDECQIYGVREGQ